MKRADKLDDGTFRALLRDYRTEPEDQGLRRRVEAALRAGLAGAGPAGTEAAGSRIRPARPAAAPRVLAFGAAAAALVLAVLGLGLFLALQPARFDQALSVASLEPTPGGQVPGGPSTGPAALSRTDREIRLDSPPGKGLVVEGQDIRIELKPASHLDIRPASLAERWTGAAPIQYRLDSGGMSVVHGPRAPDFRLATPFGELRPAGTAFSISLDSRVLDLSVSQGAVEFRETAGRLTRLAAGQSLHLGPARAPEPGGRPAAEPAAAPVADPVPALAKDSPAATAAVPGPSAQGGPGPTAAALATLRPAEVQPKDPGPILRVLWRQDLAPAPAARLCLSPAGVEPPVLLLADGARLRAWNRRTGAALWDRSLERRPQDLAPSPDGLVVHGGGALECLDWQDGGSRWTAPASPLSLNRLAVAGDRLALASADGSLTSWNAGTGQVESRFALGAGSYGTPLLGTGRIIVSRLPRQLVALDAQSGQELWSYSAAARFAADRPLALAGGSLVRIMDSAGTWYGLDAASGAERFRLEASPRLLFGPVQEGALVLAQDAAGFYALDGEGRRHDFPGADCGGIRALAIPVAGKSWLVAAARGIWTLDPACGRWRSLETRSLEAAAAEGQDLATLDAAGRLECGKVVD
jgi:hypothetical protein